MTKTKNEQIVENYLEKSGQPKSTIEIRDEVCRKTKHGITCSGLKGILRSGKFKRNGKTEMRRLDGSAYEVDVWMLSKWENMTARDWALLKMKVDISR